MLQIKAAVVAAALMALTATPLFAQTDEDDDDGLSGGALAVLLLGVGGAVSSTDLQPQLKTALDRYRLGYTQAQLSSLSELAAKQLQKKGKASKEFIVCADGGKPCVKIVRQ